MCVLLEFLQKKKRAIPVMNPLSWFMIHKVSVVQLCVLCYCCIYTLCSCSWCIYMCLIYGLYCTYILSSYQVVVCMYIYLLFIKALQHKC